MIEVERKFRCSKEQKEGLLKACIHDEEIVHHDQYFDFENLRLMKKDWWLRKRDGRWELKVTTDSRIQNRMADVYEELTDEVDIQDRLEVDLEQAIAEGVLRQIANLQTVRMHGVGDGYSLDIDEIHSLDDDFCYQMTEIEILVERCDQVEAATLRILEIAKQAGLDLNRPLGKVLEYFRQRQPHIFESIIGARDHRLK